MTAEGQTPRAPQQRRAEETRRKIMEAGGRSIAAEGYHGTSSKKIARAAGVSIGSFYAYFPDKKALLLALTGEHLREVRAITLEHLEGADLVELGSQELIATIIRAVLAVHTLSPDFHRECSLLRSRDADVKALFDREQGQWSERLVEVLGRRSDRLRVRDLEAAVRLVSHTVEATIHGLADLAPPGGEERIVEALAEMIHRYLFEPGPEGRQASGPSDLRYDLSSIKERR